MGTVIGRPQHTHKKRRGTATDVALQLACSIDRPCSFPYRLLDDEKAVRSKKKASGLFLFLSRHRVPSPSSVESVAVFYLVSYLFFFSPKPNDAKKRATDNFPRVILLLFFFFFFGCCRASKWRLIDWMASVCSTDESDWMMTRLRKEKGNDGGGNVFSRLSEF